MVGSGRLQPLLKKDRERGFETSIFDRIEELGLFIDLQILVVDLVNPCQTLMNCAVKSKVGWLWARASIR
jgi:hypothetical protein